MLSPRLGGYKNVEKVINLHRVYSVLADLSYGYKREISAGYPMHDVCLKDMPLSRKWEIPTCGPGTVCASL